MSSDTLSKPTPRFYKELPEAEMQHYYVNGEGEEVFLYLRRPDYGRAARPKCSPFYRVKGGWHNGLPEQYKAVGSRPPYGLGRLKSPEMNVLLVEGEGDVDAVLQACASDKAFINPERLVPMSWSGGPSSWRKTNWRFLAGRRVVLIPDDDEEGRKCMEDIATHLSQEHGCTKIFMVPLVKKAGTDGRDISEVIREMGDQPDRIKAIIKQNAKEFQPPKKKAERKKGASKKAPGVSALMSLPELEERLRGFVSENPHFKVLGVQGTTRRVLFRKFHGKWSSMVPMDLNGLTAVKMMRLAPLTAWAEATGIMGPIGTVVLQCAISVIEELAHLDTPMNGDDWRGLGCTEDSGRVIYHLGDRLLVDGEECDDLEGPQDKPLDFTYDYEESLRYRRPIADWRDRAKELFYALKDYSWKTEADAVTCGGWLGTALASGAFPWRLNLMLVAPSNSGKSWLIRNVLMKVLKPHCLAAYDVTEASMARQAGMTSLPIFIDEMDPLRVRQNVFPLLKASASDNDIKRIRVDTTNNKDINQQSMRTSFFISVAQKVQMPEEIANRVRVIRLGMTKDTRLDEDQWRALSKRIDQVMADDGAQEIRNGMVSLVHETTRNVRRFAREIDAGGSHSNRMTYQDAVIAAGMNLLCEWDLEMTMAVLTNRAQDFDGLGTDALDLLHRLLSCPIKGDRAFEVGGHREENIVTRSFEMPMINWLEYDTDQRSVAHQVAVRYGIRYTRSRKFAKENGREWHLVMALNHPEHKRLAKILDSREINLTDVFSNIEGVERDPQARINFASGGRGKPVIYITDEVLRRMGYEVRADGRVLLEDDREDERSPDTPVTPPDDGYTTY